MGLAVIARSLAVFLDFDCGSASWAASRTDLRGELATEERHLDV